MAKRTFYRVIYAESQMEIMQKVQGYLDIGWKLQGGVSVTKVRSQYGAINITYAQAMTREGDLDG